MALNGSGVHDTARVLDISTATVINELKIKEIQLGPVNQAFLTIHATPELQVEIVKVDSIQHVETNTGEAEMDEMWSFVRTKENSRWLWHALDHSTGRVLAYVFGRRKDEAFIELKNLLKPFGITHFLTDGWGAYSRQLGGRVIHTIGKENLQRIERRHLMLRTRRSGPYRSFSMMA